MGLAVLTGGLAFVGAANATELILDGSFENTSNSSNPIVKVGGTENPGVGGGWSFFSTYLYSTLYTMPGPANSGIQYLRPYPSGTYGITQSRQTMTQTASLTASTSLTPAKIDGGAGRFTMSAWFSSYLVQGDFSDLTLEFRDDANGVVGEPIALGGEEFVANLPTGANSKYGNAKEWAQDSKNGTIPTGARTARIKIQSTSRGGAPDGYVDVVSLDVTDAGATAPVVTNADPADKAVNVGPVVNISVVLQDRTTAVNTSSIQFLLDDNLIAPAFLQIDNAPPNTTVRYPAGLLPARSPHKYKIVFSDNGSPVTTQTHQFSFTVADYLTLPSASRSPLGTEDTTKPGFDVKVYQVDTLIDDTATQKNLTESIELSEAVLAGLLGANVADLTGAAAGNTFAVPTVIDWVNSGGTSANFQGDQPFPGIPGLSGSENSFVNEILTFVRFPTAGYYQMGVNNEDQFRLSVGTTGTLTLRTTTPENVVIPCVAIATDITQLQFGGSLPLTPLTAPVVYATPSGNADDACALASAAGLAGKIVLLDRGGSACDNAAKAEQAQLAGAVAVLMITAGDTGFPFRLGDINPNVRIPVAVIAENYGGAALRTLLTIGTAVTATIQGDPNPRIAEWNGPKGFGAVDVTVGFAVPEAGLYPLRLVAGQGADRANLEWFSIKADGTRILINDTSNPDALLAFRAVKVVTRPVVKSITLAGGQVTIAWDGAPNIKLEKTLSLANPNWQEVANSLGKNSALETTSGTAAFYRLNAQ